MLILTEEVYNIYVYTYTEIDKMFHTTRIYGEKVSTFSFASSCS